MLMEPQFDPEVYLMTVGLGHLMYLKKVVVLLIEPPTNTRSWPGDREILRSGNRSLDNGD